MGIRESIYKALQDAGLNVYLPGQYDGVCKSAYVTIGDGGVVATGKCTGRRIYLITGYVPVAKPLSLRKMMADCMAALTTVGNIRTDGSISAEYFDEEAKAIFATVEYSALCAL